MSTYAPPRLRGVDKDDLEAIVKLEATAFGTNSLTRSALDISFDPTGVLWLLAEDDEGVWGHSVNTRGDDPNIGWIVGMAIHPERQQRGWGRVLLQATIERLYEFDMNVIRLLVKPTNKVARRLYEDFGFLDTGERIDHFGPGEDRMVMSLLLPRRSEVSPVPVAHPRERLQLPQVPTDPDDAFHEHVNGVLKGGTTAR